MSKRRKGITLIGGNSLLVIFAVLCLMVFALLALSTVQADRRLADAAVQSVVEYYSADCEAEEILAKLREGEVPQGVTQVGNLFAYACPVSDTQELQVIVEWSQNNYQIQQWKVVSTTEWMPDEYIEVWTPEMGE